jgi:hypothetical protein
MGGCGLQGSSVLAPAHPVIAVPILKRERYKLGHPSQKQLLSLLDDVRNDLCFQADSKGSLNLEQLALRHPARVSSQVAGAD